MEQPNQQPEKFAEHLNEGIQPIIACVGTPKEYEAEDYSHGKLGYKSRPNIEFVNYNDEPEYIEHKGQKHGETARNMYVISDLNNRDKFSGNYYNCVGTVIAGRDKTTGKDISILCHENSLLTDRELASIRDKFCADLTESIRDIKNRCEDGTIDVVLFGGNYFNSLPNEDHYPKIITLLNSLVHKELGFDATVVSAPKPDWNGSDQAYYENGTRKLYIMKPKSLNEGAFPASKVQEHLKRLGE